MAEVQIERLRPLWAAGWVENVALDMADPGAIREHVATQWGGQDYLLTVLAADGSPVQEHKLRIAGPPRDQGRLVHRERFEGEPPPQPQHAPPAPAAPPIDMLGMLQLVMNESRESRNATQETVAAMAEAHHKNQAELLATIAESRAEAQAQTGLVGQLREFTAATREVDKIKTQLGGGAEAGGGLRDTANEQLLGMFLDRFAVPKQPTNGHRQPQAPPRRRGPRPPIPDAS
jgi:hypothetical protein